MCVCTDDSTQAAWLPKRVRAGSDRYAGPGWLCERSMVLVPFRMPALRGIGLSLLVLFERPQPGASPACAEVGGVVAVRAHAAELPGEV